MTAGLPPTTTTLLSRAQAAVGRQQGTAHPRALSRLEGGGQPNPKQKAIEEDAFLSKVPPPGLLPKVLQPPAEGRGLAPRHLSNLGTTALLFPAQ